ncbi:JmjC domain-containing protein [Novosphingobium piscinae]|uniref:Cupin domain-containing protein n=1 Tax=Novosphingobium piscinae TaxID=1507448 RepID=A0A7X1FWQ3_9SPHN|nr:cupin domain-containing protein [Novosphingobium piscinae]MBC2668418.1 cupin domain-containing protein [Novosphingobium piscinae]
MAETASFAPLALRGFDPAGFLRQTWQREPLLLRQAWAEWHNPLEPDELAGLACEPGVESRLITGPTLQVEHGPLSPDRFATLGPGPWTLLVQAVDQQVPAVAALIEPFRFLPNWRIDDVMVSYATRGGGVGPHFDQYDVFLVQGLGIRRWRVGPRCDAATALQPHDDLRLLAGFTAEHDWVLEPGDILYLPPGFAHDGVALSDDCMTYSIGFRAPSVAELTAAWCDEILSQLSEDERYGDAGAVTVQDNPGEIAPAAIARMQAMVLERLADPGGFARLFGAHVTQPRYPEVDWSPDRPLSSRRLRAACAQGLVLERNPASRLAFVANGDDACVLFVDGSAEDCTGERARCARQLCAGPRTPLDPAWSEATLEFVRALCNRGVLALIDPA